MHVTRTLAPPCPDHALACASLPAGHATRILAAEARAIRGGAAAWLDLAFELFSAFHFERAHAALNEALRRDGQLLAAHWLRFQFPLAPAPASDQQARQFAESWMAGMAAFEALDFRHEHLRRQVWGCVGSCTSFYRHYLGDDATAGLQRHGRLVHRMMAALDPGDPIRPIRRGRRRVLVCSAHLYRHTVARLFLPLFEALDPRQFDLHFIHLGSVDDDMTARARAAGTFHEGPREAFAWRSLVRELSPDVIVYLEIGMNPIAQGLAALRLAPVQCMLWGHPVTTGLPSIDHVLSPDAFEPENAREHYSEQLVRLPGFGHGLDDTPSGNEARPERQADVVDLLCAQSVYKLLPLHDVVFARILAKVPAARLHLVPHQAANVHDWLRERMRPCMEAHGVDVDERVVMHGYGSLEDFVALADVCAVNLDTIGWSGCMTAIDLLARGIPTVTIEGRSMRGRQTACLLRDRGLHELVASDIDAYVDTAVALATNPARRRELEARLHRPPAGSGRRSAVARALADFLAGCQPRTPA